MYDPYTHLYESYVCINYRLQVPGTGKTPSGTTGTCNKVTRVQLMKV